MRKKHGFTVIKAEIPGMWRVKWPDSAVSADYYNRAWAKENAHKMEEEWNWQIRQLRRLPSILGISIE